MALHNELGKKGEDIACDYLLKKGYSILTRNWRFRHRELDIVAVDGDDLVIVEVRTRKNMRWGDPRDSIKASKIKFLVHAAEGFVKYHKIDKDIRFDLIFCLLDDDKLSIEHVKNAFTAQSE
ncbi:YraN family protein [Marinilabiliaceae bacterium ANBcel2]|nr:YraN family protein [Marinilabiliaceae bacterium ANBcel2]